MTSTVFTRVLSSLGGPVAKCITILYSGHKMHPVFEDLLFQPSMVFL